MCVCGGGGLWGWGQGSDGCREGGGGLCSAVVDSESIKARVVIRIRQTSSRPVLRGVIIK